MMIFAPKVSRLEFTQAMASDTASGSNAAAVITIPASPGIAHAIQGILWSYSGSGTLAGGRLTVADGSFTVLDVDISAKGQDFIPFRGHGSLSSSLVITLAAGGSNVTGKVTIIGYVPIESVQADARGELDFSAWQNSGLLAAI